MKNSMKRLLSMVLVLCMVVSLFPVSAFAAEETTVAKGVDPNVTGDGVVYVAGEPELSCDYRITGEHTHSDSCYVLTCDHKDGHISTCYASTTTYELCTHTDDSQHTGSVNVSDVVTISWSGASWKTSHPACPVVKATYDSLSGWDKANILTMEFCYTVTAGETPVCDHYVSYGEGHSAVPGACYGIDTVASALAGCKLYEHTHVDPDCYSVTWTPYDDLNNNEIIDGTEADPYVDITYTDGVSGAAFADQTTKTVVSATTEITTPAFAGSTENYSGWAFAGWSPSVAATVTGAATYIAVWHPIVSFDSNGGSAVESQTIVPGNTANEPATTYEWHTFNGWFNGNEKFDFDTKITAPVSLTASWTEYGVSSLTIKDAEIPYVNHSTPDFSAEENLKSNLMNFVLPVFKVDNEQQDWGVFTDDLTFYVVTADANGNRVETELTSVYNYSNEAGATLTVCAKLPETETWQAAQSDDVTLTLVKAPGQNAINLGTVSGASLEVKVNDSIVEFTNGTIGLAKSDGNTGDSVVITVTANDGYYLSDESISVIGSNVTTNVAEDKKTATVSFTANNYDGEAYTISVNAGQMAQCVINATSPVTMEAADLGAIASTYTDDYLKEIFNVSVTNDPNAVVNLTRSKNINAPGTYTITFYHSTTDNTLIAASPVDVTLTIVDARPVSTINVNGSGVVYMGQNISAAEVLEKLFVSVASGETVVLEELDTSLVTIESLQKKDLASWSAASAVTEAGTYRATIKYKGSNEYQPAELVNYEFTVTDGREPVTISFDKNVSIKGEYPASYDIVSLLDALNFTITANGLSIDEKTYGEHNVDIKVYKGLDILNPITEITEAGTYGIIVVYPGTTEFKAADTGRAFGVLLPVAINVAEGRTQPAIALTSANTSLATLDAELSVADVLKLMNFSLYTNVSTILTSENYTADNNLTVSITGENGAVSKVTEPGTYTVKVSYAENDKYFGCDAVEATLTVTDGRLSTSLTINNSGEIAYNTHNADAWKENWKASIFSAMGISVMDNANAVLADAAIELYTVAEGAETELTAYPGSGTFTVRAKFAGDNANLPAVSADATLILVEAPGASTIAKGNISNAEILVTVDGVEAPWSATGTISVPYQSSAVITVKAVGEYYLAADSIKLNGETFANGSSVTASVYAGETFTLDVVPTEKADSSISVNTSYEDKVADLSKIGYTEADMVEFFAPSVAADADAKIQISGYESINAIGEYTINFTYAGSETVKASSATATLIVIDGRAATSISAKENTEIGYVGKAISKADILKAVEASVSPEAADSSKLVIDGKIQKQVYGDFYLPAGEGISGDGVEGILGLVGNYKVTVKYAENNQYFGSTKDVYFSVYDNRAETEVVAADATKQHTELSSINYDLNAVKAAFSSIEVKDKKTNKTLSGADVSVATISKLKDDGSVESVVYNNEGLLNYDLGKVDKLPITEAGVYKVEFKFVETTTHKESKGAATLTIVDARLEGTVEFGTKTYAAAGADFIISKDTVLADLYKGIDYKGEELFKPEEGLTAKIEMIEADKRTELEAITSTGSYELTVSFAGDDEHKAAEGKIAFTVTDGRKEVNFKIALADGTVPYDFSEDGLTYDELVAALGITSEVDGKEANITGYTVTISQDNISGIADYVPGEYKVVIDYKGDYDYFPRTQEFNVTVKDMRPVPVLKLKQDVTLGSYVEGVSYSEADILAAVVESLKTADGKDISYADASAAAIAVDVDEIGTLSVNPYGMSDAGEYEVTVKFSGDWNNQAVEAKTNVTITKAAASLTVTETKLHYTNDGVDTSGYNAKNMIAVDPAAADVISFVVGLSLGNNASAELGTVVYVDMPQLVSDELMANPIVKAALDKLAGGTEMTISEFKSALEGILDAAEAAGNLGINISTEAIEALASALNTIEGMEGVGSLTIKATMGQPLTITNSGLYLVGGVITDANYETAFGMNYLVISPDGMKVELAWNVEDVNGFYTIENIRNGNHDFGARIANILEGVEADAAKHIRTVFLGVDMNGEPVMIEDPMELQLGVYTEIAYIHDLGNTMYYAEPIIREVIVVTEAVQVKFIDENGNENPHREFTWEDGVVREMKAVVYGQDGVTKLADSEQAKITYTYLGIESDGEAYNSSTGPVKPGTYTVIAAYRDAAELSEVTKVGMAVGAMVIKPQTATISVNDLIRPYEAGKSDSLLGLIEKTPDDAKMAVMVAGISNVGDYSEEGLAAVEGVVYIDLPDRVESALQQIRDSEYVTVDNFKAMAAPLAAMLEAAGIETADIKAFYNELAALPGELTVEFFDASSYNFEEMGSYVVVAGIMDSDYYPAVDTGLVVIHPEVHEYTLAWNYDDANSIITRPVLETEDLLAHALDAESVKNADVTASIKYIVYGVDDEGNEVSLSGDNSDEAFVEAMRTLPNGVYTQMAYVEFEVDADMIVAAPIMRQFILTPQDITITVPNSTFTYGDDALADYPGTITATYRDGTPLTAEELENMTVKYIGVNATDGGYYRETLPENVGVYGVFAEYKTVTETGELEHYGIGLGTLTIQPARLSYDVKNSHHVYDGAEKSPVISNPKGASDILFIVDTQNATVNVVAPSLGQDKDPNYNWDGDIHIQYWLEELDRALAEAGTDKVTVIAKLESALAKLEELTGLVIIESDSYQDIMGVLEDIDSDVLTLNAGMPVGEAGKVCKYNVYAVAYKDPNHAIEISEGVMTIAPIEIRITLNDQAKVYGQADPELSYTVEYYNYKGEKLQNASCDFLPNITRVAGEDVGTYAISAAPTTANVSFIFAEVEDAKLEITPAKLTITVEDKEVNVGDAMPEFTYTVEGLVNGNVFEVELKCSAADTKTAGEYEIDATYTENKNYEVTVNKGKFTVTKAEEEEEVKVEVKPDKLNLPVGDTYELEYSVEPEGTEIEKVVWSSSDDSVVSVDENGKITANSAGKAIITVEVTTKDGNTYEATCEVNVGYPIRFVPNDANGVIVPGVTVFIDGEARELDENCIAWDEEPVLGRKMAVSYVYKNSGDHTTDYAYTDTTKNMYIFDLVYDEELQEYNAVRMTALDDLFNFAGASIWLSGSGVNGIRAFYSYNGETAAAVAAFNTLGYRVVEHGTVLDWAKNLGGSEPALRDDRSNAAPGHSSGNNLFNDTIYPLRDEYITPDLRVRFYAVLEDIETGETTILYSGSVQRSIGYVAHQNRETYVNSNSTYHGWVMDIINKAADQGVTY